MYLALSQTVQHIFSFSFVVLDTPSFVFVQEIFCALGLTQCLRLRISYNSSRSSSTERQCFKDASHQIYEYGWAQPEN